MEETAPDETLPEGALLEGATAFFVRLEREYSSNISSGSPALLLVSISSRVEQRWRLELRTMGSWERRFLAVLEWFVMSRRAQRLPSLIVTILQLVGTMCGGRVEGYRCRREGGRKRGR